MTSAGAGFQSQDSLTHHVLYDPLSFCCIVKSSSLVLTTGLRLSHFMLFSTGKFSVSHRAPKCTLSFAPSSPSVLPVLPLLTDNSVLSLISIFFLVLCGSE